MNKKSNMYFIFSITAVLFFIRCRIPSKIIRENEKISDIAGQYVNKIKVSHFSEILELLKDSSFFLLTKYEWSKYEYKGVWKLQGDTLILECDNNIDLSDKKYLKYRLLLRENFTELFSLASKNYSLIKERH